MGTDERRVVNYPVHDQRAPTYRQHDHHNLPVQQCHDELRTQHLVATKTQTTTSNGERTTQTTAAKDDVADSGGSR